VCAMKDATGDMQEKNPAAVALGKLRARTLTFEERSKGGKKGVRTRNRNLSAEERSEIAKKAAAARWAKKAKADK